MVEIRNSSDLQYIQSALLELNKFASIITDNNYQTIITGSTLSDLTTAQFDFKNVLDNSLVIGKNSLGFRGQINNLVNAFNQIRECVVDNLPEKFVRIPSVIDKIVNLGVSFQGTLVRPKGYDNANFVPIPDEHHVNARQSLENLFQSALPKAFKDVEISRSQIPHSILEKLTGTMPEIYELLIIADSQRTENDNFQFRHKVITKILELEHKRYLGEFPEIPVFTYALAGSMYGTSDPSPLGSVLQNYLTDLTIQAEEPRSFWRAISDRESDPLRTLKLIGKILGNNKTSFLWGRLMASRHEADIVNGVEYLDSLLSHEDSALTDRNLLSLFTNLASRVVQGGRILYSKTILEGMQSLDERCIYTGSELDKLFVMKEEQKSCLEIGDIIDQVTQADTEIFIRSKFAILDNVTILEKHMKGALSFVVSVLDNKITGELDLKLSSSKSKNYSLPFTIELNEEGEYEVQLNILNGFGSEKAKKTIMKLVHSSMKAYLKEKESVNQKPYNPTSSVLSSEVKRPSRTERMETYVPSKRRPTKDKPNQPKIDLPLSQPIKTLNKEGPNQIGLNGLDKLSEDLGTQGFDKPDEIEQEIMNKINYYLQYTSASRKMFGKPLSLGANASGDLRQITVRPRKGALELRLYFTHEDGAFRYRGLLHKHEKSEQDLFIKQLLERIKSEN